MRVRGEAQRSRGAGNAVVCGGADAGSAGGHRLQAYDCPAA